jgi:hypothetical protein
MRVGCVDLQVLGGDEVGIGETRILTDRLRAAPCSGYSLELASLANRGPPHAEDRAEAERAEPLDYVVDWLKNNGEQQ